MGRLVKCPYCENKLDKDEAYEHKKRYYHQLCFETWQREGQDYKDLKTYINKLYGNGSPTGMHLKQIKDFKEDLGYKYKGMELALRYFHETLGNRVQEGGGIGIIPFVYEDAKRHFITKMKVEESVKQLNTNIEEKVITVQSPKFTYQKNIKKIDISSL